ncbi:MAG: hypothetical protein JNK15_16570, partial [Planctomycetes bacterium]|nr:hypothetical protein [Planctomycetota bacterium]
MRHSALPSILLASLVAMSSGCTFHSTATHWNGRTAADGRPVWMTTTTTYGVNLLVLLPFVGDTRADALVDEATA